MRKNSQSLATELYPHETIWLREFARLHGLENITRFCFNDLNGVPLVRIQQALILGYCLICEKCDGPGTTCKVRHVDEDGVAVEVDVHFESNTEVLNIEEARYVENDNEPEAA